MKVLHGADALPQLPESDPVVATKRVAGWLGGTGGSVGTRTVTPGATVTLPPPTRPGEEAPTDRASATRRSVHLPSAQAITLTAPDLPLPKAEVEVEARPRWTRFATSRLH